MRSLFNMILLAFVLNINFTYAGNTKDNAQTSIHWQALSNAIFEQAKRENKFVILDLEAVWCHWCHVMEDKTYHNPAVIKLIKQKYIAVRVDQDANPDISNRYEDYGWPATIVFATDGSEIVKRRGFIPPQLMASLLQEIINDPTPGPSIGKKIIPVVGTSIQFDSAKRDQFIGDINSGYDTKLGGWGEEHKFILAPNVEYALICAKSGDKAFEYKVRETLDAALGLIDPVWGGVYQYSDRGRWDSPHFEKIMSIQSDDLRLYSVASVQFHEERYLKAARNIERYLIDFLTSPEGAFYTSQDADVSTTIDGHMFYPLDDKSRRALGMPHIDKTIYTRENGWAIKGLLALYDAIADRTTLQRAVVATRWIEQNRQLPEGGFSHGAKDRAGPYLGDTLAMADAYLALYTSTGDRAWLAKSKSSVAFIQKQFKTESGFVTVANTNDKGVFQQPIKQSEENIGIARLANQLFHYTGDEVYQKVAEYAMKYIVALANADSSRYQAGALIAADEIAEAPAHITVVGAKTDAAAIALHDKAIQYPALYRRIEWWDKTEGAMPNSDVHYPQLERAAAFVCVNHACSTPIFEPEKISTKADLLLFGTE